MFRFAYLIFAFHYMDLANISLLWAQTLESFFFHRETSVLFSRSFNGLDEVRPLDQG